jgi:hypothetical protein
LTALKMAVVPPTPVLQQLPQAEDEVLTQLREVFAPPHVSIPFPANAPAGGVGGADVAELPQRLGARGLGGQAARHILAGTHLEVKGELAVHLLGDARLPEPRPE